MGERSDIYPEDLGTYQSMDVKGKTDSLVRTFRLAINATSPRKVCRPGEWSKYGQTEEKD